ncbi:MAG: hypothetical protein EBV97_05590 [Rhodobacteraceae bacterium]|nr:hypothetical protein [Paracoccaceae bacterium]
MWQGGFEIELIFGPAVFCLEQKDRGGRRKGMPSGVVDIASERGKRMSGLRLNTHSASVPGSIIRSTRQTFFASSHP